MRPMTEVEVQLLKKAVEHQHGGRARFVAIVPVNVSFEGNTVESAVHVFELDGRTKSTRAYAWSLPGGTRRISTVLHLGAVQSARDAVHATIVGEQRSEKHGPKKVRGLWKKLTYGRKSRP
jgi:hypothetical protein